MPHPDYDKAVLWMTAAQFRFVAQNAGAAGLLSLYNQLAARSSTDFIEPMTEWTTPEGFYSAVGDFLPAGQLFIVPETEHFLIPPNQPPTGLPRLPDPGPIGIPAPQLPGVLASPLPTLHRIGGSMWPAVWTAVRMAAAGGSRGLGGGSLLSRILALLGGFTIGDWLLDRVGANDDQKELAEKFLEALADMEAAGMIHPYTPSRRFSANGQTDPGPVFFIFNLEKVQGFYTNFHMSRSGLQAHDDRQDTYKRPRAARRRSAPSGRRS